MEGKDFHLGEEIRFIQRRAAAYKTRASATMSYRNVEELLTERDGISQMSG
jgi:hypothetical protein